MLNMSKLIQGIEEKYIPMLKKVDIPNFTKAIAVFSNLKLNEISDDVIKDYLHTWAKNKYFLFKFLGNNLTKNEKVFLKKDDEDKKNQIRILKEKYAYALFWIDEFSYFKENKIIMSDLNHYLKSTIRDLFMEEPKDGISITNFFKNWLKAPEELVTDLAKLWEGQDGDYYNYTISIDPIDYMFASETPFEWSSCYSIHKAENEETHADGCLAAMLDGAHAISYTWKNEGKYAINKFEFKNIKYKHLRQWIVFSKDLLKLYFCRLYPESRRDGDNAYERTLRLVVERMVSEYLGIKDNWVKTDEVRGNIIRVKPYGYDEFHQESIIIHKSLLENSNYTLSELLESLEPIEVYTETIKCPCGCNSYLEGTDFFDMMISPSIDELKENGDIDKINYLEYIGGGLNCKNYVNKRYCKIGEQFCENNTCKEECGDCEYWLDKYEAVCPITKQLCENNKELVRSYPTEQVEDRREIVCGNCDKCEIGCKYINNFMSEEEKEEVSSTLFLPDEMMREMGAYRRRLYLDDYICDDDMVLTKQQILNLSQNHYNSFYIAGFVSAVEAYKERLNNKDRKE